MNFRLHFLPKGWYLVSGVSTRTTPFVFILLCQSEFTATVTKGTHTLFCQFITPLDILSVNFFFTKKIILMKKRKFPKQSISVTDISGLMVFEQLNLFTASLPQLCA